MAALAEAERDLEAKASSVAGEVETALAELSRAQQEQQAQDDWGRLLLLVTTGDLELTQGPGRDFTATVADGQPAEAWVQDRLKTTRPLWVNNAIAAIAQLERVAATAEEAAGVVPAGCLPEESGRAGREGLYACTNRSRGRCKGSLIAKCGSPCGSDGMRPRLTFVWIAGVESLWTLARSVWSLCLKRRYF